MADAKVKDVKIDVKGDKVTVISEYKLSELHGGRDFITYNMTSEITNQVIAAIKDEVIKVHGKKIIEQVLKEVNWPDIVRSEIARKVIAEAGRDTRIY